MRTYPHTFSALMTAVRFLGPPKIKLFPQNFASTFSLPRNNTGSEKTYRPNLGDAVATIFLLDALAHTFLRPKSSSPSQDHHRSTEPERLQGRGRLTEVEIGV
jgi:hypothetical protein